MKPIALNRDQIGQLDPSFKKKIHETPFRLIESSEACRAPWTWCLYRVITIHHLDGLDPGLGNWAVRTTKGIVICGGVSSRCLIGLRAFPPSKTLIGSRTLLGKSRGAAATALHPNETIDNAQLPPPPNAIHYILIYRVAGARSRFYATSCLIPVAPSRTSLGAADRGTYSLSGNKALKSVLAPNVVQITTKTVG
ncbi:hypothetical protein KQX54_002547 [Cotesia glomerata]|uniref:Uncharacterized protein n=1 Tax=Cotesia glomerata TaxID=32391 RepID=A0AAV7IFB6_COTGL|nr:hypothetical protein KQX54_002547 [Cotesia glomerata]